MQTNKLFTCSLDMLAPIICLSSICDRTLQKANTKYLPKSRPCKLQFPHSSKLHQNKQLNVKYDIKRQTQFKMQFLQKFALRNLATF